MDEARFSSQPTREGARGRESGGEAPKSEELGLGIGQQTLAWLAWLSVGAAIGYAAWGSGRTPLLAILIPLLCFSARSRSEAFLLALGYHLAVVRFLPDYAKAWFDEPLLGLPIWLGVGFVSAAGWATGWTASSDGKRVALASLCALAITLLPPVAVVLPGHPVVAWGFLLEGTGWVGLFAAIAATMGGCVLVRRARVSEAHVWHLPLVMGLIAAFLVTLSLRQDRMDGSVVGDMAAFATGWGSPPRTDEEIIARLEKAGAMAREASGGEGGARLVVFPETSMGKYDTSFGPVFRNELVAQAQAGRQAIMIGGEVALPDRTAQNLAVLIRRDGTISYVTQRQPAPISMWAPWKDGHFPADWFGTNTLQIEPGLRARVIFCYEEYLPFLTLINEARDPHTLVVVMANGWAIPNLEASHIQETHTEGLARLFGRKYLRAENYQPALYREQHKRQLEGTVGR